MKKISFFDRLAAFVEFIGPLLFAGFLVGYAGLSYPGFVIDLALFDSIPESFLITWAIGGAVAGLVLYFVLKCLGKVLDLIAWLVKCIFKKKKNCASPSEEVPE